MSRATTTSPRAVYLAAHGAPRVCLHCGRKFPSEGPSNRICPKCAGLNLKVGTPECRVRGLMPDFPDDDDWR